MKDTARIALTLLLTALLLSTLPTAGCSDSTTNPVDTTNGVTLTPPPADQGFQLAIGPFNVPVGKEGRRNYYQKLASDSAIYITKIEFKANDGTHHLKIYKGDNIDVPNHTDSTEEDILWDEWALVGGAELREYSWTLPPGVALKLDPHQQMLFQLHGVNAGTAAAANGGPKALVNFWTTDKKNVTSVVGTIVASNRSIEIPPKTSATFGKLLKPSSSAVKLMMISGFFFGKGKSFAVGHWDGTLRQLTDTIYSSEEGEEPEISQISPLYSLGESDTLACITTYENPTDKAIMFGTDEASDERSDLIISFFPGPADGKTIYDFRDGFLIESHPL